MKGTGYGENKVRIKSRIENDETNLLTRSLSDSEEVSHISRSENLIPRRRIIPQEFLQERRGRIQFAVRLQSRDFDAITIDVRETFFYSSNPIPDEVS